MVRITNHYEFTKEKFRYSQIRSFSLSVLFSLCSCCCFGQTNDKSLEYYDAGNKAFAEKNYQLADSLFTISLQLKPHPDTYYNRAMVRKKLENKEGYCSDLNNASLYGDKEAKKLFWKNCVESDSAYYTKEEEITQDTSNYEYKQVRSKWLFSDRVALTKYNNKRELLVSYNITNSDTLYGKCDKDPTYIGGEGALLQFISSNIKYPPIERDNGIQGKAYITFIVDKEGNVTNVELLKGIKGAPNCNKEALRVVSMMPKWKPGVVNEKPVKCKFILPVTFKLG